MNLHINEKLKHLDLESIEELMRLYYSNEKNNKELISLYNIDIKSPSLLYKLFPPQKLDNSFCPCCESDLYINRPSKSASSYSINPEFCPVCNHIEISTCDCDFCVEKRHLERKALEEKRKLEIKNRRNLVLNHYPISNLDSLHLDDISFRDKVYLGSLLRASLAEDLSTILPVEDTNLTPNGVLTSDILKLLYSKDIIKVHPDFSSLDAFTSNSEMAYPSLFYIYKVHYLLNIKYSDCKDELINELLYPNYFTEEDVEVAYDLWREVALNECIEYLLYNMQKVKFDFSPGEKTFLLINNLLDNFSVSQIFYIIHSSIGGASRHYLEGNISKGHAANSVISRCQTKGEKILLGNWSAYDYFRPADLPQSCLSEFLFNKVLKIGDKGFTVCPSIDVISNNF